MKSPVKIIIIIALAAAAGGFVYWQYNKRKIVKDSIKDAIAKKTDSLYFVHYDSSSIDEINGNIAFYNVVLQSDEEQKKILNSTDSLPNALYNIRIDKIGASGIDVAGLLQKENVAAKKIMLLRPVIQIINTGADKPRPFTIDDTMALYKKILGKLNSIKADTIQIVNGTLLVTNKAGKSLATMEGINISVNNFLIDETKNYHTLVSYFIKDVQLSVENIQLPVSKNNTRLNIEKLDYNAVQRFLNIGTIRQYKLNDTKPVTDLHNLHISDLNTDAFILQARLKAGEISCDGGLVTVYTGGSKASTSKGLELSSDVIDQAQIAGIRLGKTKIIILKRDDPSAPPLVIDNATFKVLTPVKIVEGTTVNNLLNNAQWEFAGDGFAVNTKDNMYQVGIGAFVLNNMAGTAMIKSFFIKPLLTEAEFVKRSTYQQDQYNIDVRNIRLKGVNIQRLLNTKEMEIDQVTMQPVLKIFNDKTLPPGNDNKIGHYPHQLLQKVKFPIYIKTLVISNGMVSYRERAAVSRLVGNVFFTNLAATISNITNIPARTKTNPVMVVEAQAKFLGAGNLKSTWRLPMNSTNGAFTISGNIQDMDATVLNKLIEPIALASVKKGHINKVDFYMEGSDTKANANVLFLYKDLNLEMLKRKDDELKKKGLVSALANTFIKNNNENPENKKAVLYERDATRSFFNLVWKTIYTGVKNTALGKKSKEENAPK